jgi:GTP cyclohydrolase I
MSVIEYAEKTEKIEKCFKNIFEELGLNYLTDSSFKESPKRIAKNLVEKTSNVNLDFLSEEFIGLWKTFEFDSENKLLEVKVEKFSFSGTCPHHFLPIFGKAKVCYFPKGSILGISKFKRILSSISETCPMTQEDLTVLYSKVLQKILKTEKVSVKITAKHTCMMCRGVKDSKAKTVTKI